MGTEMREKQPHEYSYVGNGKGKNSNTDRIKSYKIRRKAKGAKDTAACMMKVKVGLV